MEYVPLRTPAAEPYHYHHVTDQTKSLQELQNEVGALLEFRDLVIETFPDLKSKMASSAANSTLTGISSTSSSLAIRREWEPGGIRIRRKLIPKDTGSGSIGGGGSSSTTIIPGGGGSNGGSISSNHSNTVGLGASSGSAPAVANVAGSSSGGTTTTTVLNHHLQQQQQQQQQQQHSHQHHHHHHQHHHTQTQHGSNSSGNHPHQQQQQQQQHSSSSLIRSRSNSHSGKKEPKSGEGNNGSVIQDSGFSTETSSSKETHSAASSTSGAVQGGLILSTTINRLAVETEDELWNLLDVIHRKGSRLREEVDLHLEREKSRATNLAINHPPHHHHHAHHHPPHQPHPHQQQQQHVASAVVPSPTSSGAVASAGGVAAPVPPPTHHHGPVAAARIGGSSGGSSSSHSSNSSSSGNNITIHHSNPAATTATSVVASTDGATGSSTTTTTVIVSGAGPTVATSAVAKSFQSQLLHTTTTDPSGAATAVGGGQPPVDHNVQILRNERDRLLDKLSAYEAETFAGRIREAKMHDELETLTLTMRDLQEQLKVANSQKVELNSKLHDLHLQTVNRSAPSSPESIKVRQQHTPIPPPPASSASLASSSSSSPADAQQSPAHALRAPSRYHLLQGNGKSSSSVAAPPPPLPPLDDPALVEADPKAAHQPPVGVAGLGRLDALLGSPPRLQKVRTLDSKKIAAILLETNIVELQRHLLTVTVQNQILQQRLDQATRSRLFLSEKFEKSKEDLDDLRFQLMEKSIELEGTKAQLRVIESKSTSGGKSAPPSAETSPEHHTAAGRGGATVQQQQQQQHHNAGHLMQHHQLHHHHHHHHHQQHHANVVSSVTVNSQLAMRLPSSQVSTPSMKAMTPVAMDDMIALHHSSSTESAQDQAERDISIGGNRLHQQQQQQQQQQSQQHQAPETPRRRPSKIPLPGTKGSAAPKPPSGRNFSATPTPTTPTGPSAMQQRPLGGGGSSGPSSNRSLTKSTGSLYVRSVDAGSFGAAGPHQHPGAGATTGAGGSSWRNSSSSSSNNSKETPSLEKSRSSSIPISSPSSSSVPKLGGGPQPPPISPPHRATPTMMTLPPPPIPPTAYGGVISSSPLPRPKRDTLTTKVKNCDSLSRKQSLRKDAPSTNSNANATTSIGSGQSSTSVAPPPAIRERKPSAGGGGGVLRHASSTSLGSADTPSGGTNVSSATNSTNTTTTTTPSDNGKRAGYIPVSSRFARRSNTFRLAKPTLTPLLLATGPPGPGFIVASPLPGIGVTGTKTSGSVEASATSHRGNGGSARTRSKTSTGGTTSSVVPPPAVVRASFSTPSVANVLRDEDAGGGTPGERIARNLIGEYLAAKKTKCDVQQQQQQHHNMSIPPPIFHVHQMTASGHIHQQQQREMDELAYKHPILLRADEDEEDDEEVALGGANRPLDSEDDCSIELVLQDDARDDQQRTNTMSYDSKDGEDDASAANESLIVPRPKMIAFHSLKGTKEGQRRPGSPTTVTAASTTTNTCRLVGKVNPNILKTWEQLSGQQTHNSCVHQQQRSASTGRMLLLAEAATGTIRQQPLRRRTAVEASSSGDGCLYFDTEHNDDDNDDDDDGESADERQSCLLYCPQQRTYPHDEGGEREEEDVMIEFKVNKLQHHHPAAAATTVSDSRTTSSGLPPAGSTSSEGVDFYDSIDAVSTPLPPGGPNAAGMLLTIDDSSRPPEEGSYTDLPSVAGGEGLAEFTSIDRKRLWSIEISEQ